jgi:hypothetical protein
MRCLRVFAVFSSAKRTRENELPSRSLQRFFSEPRLIRRFQEVGRQSDRPTIVPLSRQKTGREFIMLQGIMPNQGHDAT